MNRDYKHGKSDRMEWGQGFIGNFSSGFTQGTVGFGVDAFGLYALRLDGGRAASALPASTSSSPVTAATPRTTSRVPAPPSRPASPTP